MKQRAGTLLFWALPPLCALAFYWYGLHTWFQQDDFAWLGLPLEIHSVRDVPRILFEPRAQGSLRPLSERLFFLTFSTLTPLDPRPMHAVVFATFLAAMALLQSLMLRMTGSRAAAFVAPFLWMVNVGLADPMSWLSAYNQVLSSFFLLAALRCLAAAVDTGKRRWWILQWACFLLGLGALEVVVVYPALALAWCWLFAREHWKKTLPMFAVSAAYAALHFRYAPKPTAGPYVLHWDLTIVPTYFRYWGHVLAGGSIRGDWRVGDWAWQASAWACGLLGLSGTFWMARKRLYTPLYGAIWFTCILGPLLPLRDHFSDYYLAGPAIGAAMAGAALVRYAWQAGVRWRLVAVVCLAAYCTFHIAINREITVWRLVRGMKIRALVEGLERAHELHPDKLILLRGIDTELFWSGLLDEPFRLFGLRQVYLLPGEETTIESHPELGDITPFLTSKGVAGRALRRGEAALYVFEGTHLRNITRTFAKAIPNDWIDSLPDEIDVGQSAFADSLGEGWLEPAGPGRWMGPKATVKLAAARAGRSRLYLKGFRPMETLTPPVRLQAVVNGTLVGEAVLSPDGPSFELSFAIPENLWGKPVTVEILVDPPAQVQGVRYGAVFGRIGLR